MIKVATKQDFDLAFEFTKHTSAKINLYIRILFIVTLSGAATVFSVLSTDLFEKILYPVLFFIAIVLLCVFFPRQFTKALKKQQETNKLLSEQTENVYTFNDENITVDSTKDGEYIGYSKLTYPQIYKVDETPKFLFIFLSATQAFIIAKSAFDSQEAMQEAVAYLKKVAKYKVFKK